MSEPFPVLCTLLISRPQQYEQDHVFASLVLSSMPRRSIIYQIAGLHGAHSVPWPLAGPSHDGSGFRAYVQSASNKRKASEVGIRGGEPAAKLANHPMAKPGVLAGIQKVSIADPQILSRLLPSSHNLYVSSRHAEALLCTCLAFVLQE